MRTLPDGSNQSPGVEGVTDVEVALNPGQAKVNYDSSKIDIEDLKGVITESGYKV
jgi:copper chaperone CopZ